MQRQMAASQEEAHTQRHTLDTHTHKHSHCAGDTCLTTKQFNRMGGKDGGGVATVLRRQMETTMTKRGEKREKTMLASGLRSIFKQLAV